MVSLLGATSNGLFFSLLAALSATIITLSMWVQEPVLQTIWHFGSPIETIFSAPYTLLWMLGAYLVLAFVRS
ncbi:MAG TPA: hypothetical protein VMU27_00205, partial [Candidatus Paceibacterota bacterium]|nr:hypothetical protein [Candidatus Paceibacterota bacterium]